MSSHHQQGMDRRRFLIVSSASALATAALGPKLFGAESAFAPKRLSVGYAALEDLATLVPASSIPASDGGFIGRGARVTASGASGASAVPRDRRSVELLTHFQYFDGAERRSASFRAWGCSRKTGCQGSPVGFTVPVDETQNIAFTIGVERGAPAGAATRREAISIESTESVALALTLGLHHDAPLKLARGVYVIVPLFEGDSDPRWSAWTLQLIEGRWALVDSNGVVAPFEHFVLRIDYASQP